MLLNADQIGETHGDVLDAFLVDQCFDLFRRVGENLILCHNRSFVLENLFENLQSTSLEI